MEETKKIKVRLSGTDGNVFAIIGRVSGALKAAGQRDAAKEFQTKALSCKSYEEVLNLCCETVEVS